MSVCFVLHRSPDLILFPIDGHKTPLQRNALFRFDALSNFKLMESENN